MERPVVLFDGDCKLCIFYVEFVRGRTPVGTFRFVEYQEEEASEYLKAYPQIPRDMSTVALIDSRRVYLRSSAICRTSQYFSYP